MNIKIRLILVLLISALITGCYKVADAEYSLPDASVKREDMSKGSDSMGLDDHSKDKEEDDTQESAEEIESKNTKDSKVLSISPEDYILSYVPKIYDMNEEFHLFQAFGDDGNKTVTDLYVKVTGFEIGGQSLSSDFDYIDKEFRPFYECGSDEEIVYYTMQITAGEMHKTIDSEYLTGVNGTSLFCVGQINGEASFSKLFDFDFAFFTPVENNNTIHNIGKIALRPGETKELTYAEKVRKDSLKNDIYLCIDLLGTNMFDPDNTKPEDLTDEQRSMIAVCKVWGGMG